MRIIELGSARQKQPGHAQSAKPIQADSTQETSMKSKTMKSQTRFLSVARRFAPAVATLVVLAAFVQLLTLSGLSQTNKSNQTAKNNKVAQSGKSSKSANATRAVKQYTVEQFLNTTAIGGSSFSPDEKSILV